MDSRELYYSEFYDLVQIIRKNWDKGFKDCFGDRKRFDVYMDRLSAFRNPDAHSRALLPFEEHLVLGMAGELRQEITIYLSKGAGGLEREHFPRIEEVTDSFGNRFPGGRSEAVDTDLTLRVGDSVVFRGRAWDPDGDVSRWEIRLIPAGMMPITLAGAEFEWVWNVENVHVAERLMVEFWLISPKPYHKNGVHDGRVVFLYKVMPPYSS